MGIFGNNQNENNEIKHYKEAVSNIKEIIKNERVEVNEAISEVYSNSDKNKSDLAEIFRMILDFSNSVSEKLDQDELISFTEIIEKMGNVSVNIKESHDFIVELLSDQIELVKESLELDS